MFKHVSLRTVKNKSPAIWRGLHIGFGLNLAYENTCPAKVVACPAKPFYFDM
jgi:hypothetical protein